MKTFVVFAALLVLAGCGSTPTVTTPVYNHSEQEIIDYVGSHIDEMDELLTDIQVVLQSSDYATSTAISNDVIMLAKRYARLDASYSRTNGGDYAGGKVKRLENLWEGCGNNLRIVIKGLAGCISDPENVNIDRTAGALVDAEDGIAKLRDEFDMLTTY